MDFGEILFKLQVDTALGEHVRVVGDHEKIGSWDPLKGLVLCTTPEIYPYWISNEIIQIPRGYFSHNNRKFHYNFTLF